MSDRTAMLPAEADLLLEVNRGLPPSNQERYNDLIAKRRAETLTDEEYREILRLTEEVETLEVRRVENLVELASLRRVSLNEIMDCLGIQPIITG